MSAPPEKLAEALDGFRRLFAPVTRMSSGSALWG